MTLQETLLFLPGLLAGITVHECAHAWSASRLGDEFARRQGRVSLNPLRHLSPLGTICMFVLPFGWGKPVYINLYNFRRPRLDYFLSSIAGPIANLLMVALCLGLMQVTRHSFAFGPRAEMPVFIAHMVLLLAAIANTILAAFNLLPIPPLDGSKIWPCLFPRMKPSFSPALRQASWIILIVVMVTHALNPAINAVVGTVARIMPAPDIQVFSQRLNAAEAEMKASRHAESEKSLDEALAINPRSAECYYLRAVERSAQQKWPEAAADIHRALELDKGNADYQALQSEIAKHLPPPK
jgi:Zn-dependent protease